MKTNVIEQYERLGEKSKCRTRTESSEKEREGIMCVVVSVRHAEKKMGKNLPGGATWREA